MTIVDALKQKGATGGTIAEAVSTLPAGGGGSYFDDLGVSMNGYQGEVTWTEGAHETTATITGVMDEETMSALSVLPERITPVISEFEMTFGDHTVAFGKAGIDEAGEGVLSAGGEVVYKVAFIEGEESQPVGANLVFYAVQAEWATGTMTANLPEVELVKVNDDFATAVKIARSGM